MVRIGILGGLGPITDAITFGGLFFEVQELAKASILEGGWLLYFLILALLLTIGEAFLGAHIGAKLAGANFE